MSRGAVFGLRRRRATNTRRTAPTTEPTAARNQGVPPPITPPRKRKGLNPPSRAAIDVVTPTASGRVGEAWRRPTRPTTVPPMANAAVHHASYRPTPTTAMARPSAYTRRLTLVL